MRLSTRRAVFSAVKLSKQAAECGLSLEQLQTALDVLAVFESQQMQTPNRVSHKPHRCSFCGEDLFKATRFCDETCRRQMEKALATNPNTTDFERDFPR